MNALSLHQPWASAMALGLKTIETRSWRPPEKRVGERFVIASTKHQPGTNEYERAWGLWRDLAVARGAESQQSLPLGCIVASGVLTTALPIVGLHDDRRGAVWAGSPDCVKPDGLWWDDDPNGDVGRHARDITAERPWGDFSPGRWAWLFSDLARVEDRCPWCWGTGHSDAPLPEQERSRRSNLRACLVCRGDEFIAPIPVKGKQRVWQWEP